MGFLAMCFTVAAGLGAGAILSFNDHWALIFNLLPSITALLLAGVILVAGARDTAAIQIKLDERPRAVEQADDRLVGIEDRSAEELDLIRRTRMLSSPDPASTGPEFAEDTAVQAACRPLLRRLVAQGVDRRTRHDGVAMFAVVEDAV